MSGSIEQFFDAWGMDDDTARAEVISSVYAAEGTYTDPRAPDMLTGPAAISTYINMFSANAPGWTAKVVALDTAGTMSRATVAFGGMGPDGTEMVQHGQYFVEQTGDKITRMTGFAGLGAPA